MEDDISSLYFQKGVRLGRVGAPLPKEDETEFKDKPDLYEQLREGYEVGKQGALPISYSYDS